MDTARPRPVTVGVFDSGVGGLSVLRALHRAMPSVRLVYVADSGYAPYGERDAAYVIERSELITSFLVGQGAALVVIACNTATAAAARHLRERHPGVPFVGVEPGVKPALAMSRHKRIGVLATTGTLRSEKFQRLIAPYREHAQLHLQPCPGLAQAIEAGDTAAHDVRALAQRYCEPLRQADVDTVVLGCTHYPFAMEALRAALGPEVILVDTAEPVARHARRLLEEREGPDVFGCEPAETVAYTTGDVAVLRRIVDAWLDFPVQVRAAPASLTGPSPAQP